MMPKIESQIYPGSQPRPSVEVKAIESENLISIGVPWGTKDALDHLNKLLSDMSRSDTEEATQIGGRMPASIRYLKSILEQANSEILKSYNKESYSSACEALVICVDGQHLTWGQVGQPSVILIRDETLHVLQGSHDLSLDYDMEAPLPSNLLGVSNSSFIQYNEFVTKPGDHVLFYIGRGQPVLGQGMKSFDEILRATAARNQNESFWLGQIKF